MTSLKSDCRKFSPNIFNKNKCQNCFRTKEAHSAEALESNRSTRKVSKCGYLFVAPDWDFTVSINRTKRWQRRWFVLYDDGELTYSVDEHPDTVPQAVIDMNKALEVSDAQEVTGNQFAIAITAPEKVHFVKGTSREESRWWYDVLSRLPRNVLRHGLKHKRNATFPGGTATTIIGDHGCTSAQTYCTSEEDDTPVRQRFTSESIIGKREEEEWADWLHQHVNDDEVFPTKPTSSDNSVTNEKTDDTILNMELVNKEDDVSDKNESDSAKKGRCRRYMKREARTLRNQRSRSDGVAKMIPSRDANPEDGVPSSLVDTTNRSEDRHNSPVPARRRHTSDRIVNCIEGGKKLEFIENLENSLLTSSKPLKKSLKKSESLMDISSELSPEMRQHISELKRNHSYKGTVHSKKESLKEKSTCGPFLQPVRDTSSKSQAAAQEMLQRTGCASSWEAGVDICSQGMVLKKGWLLRRPTVLSKDEWTKHWFVVKNASFTYYRDPSAEDCGILDGVLDLNQVTSVEPLEMEKHFAFSLNMWDNKKYVLSTVSSSARISWMKAIQNASNLWDAESRRDFSNEEIVLPEHHFYSTDANQKTLEQNQDMSSSDDQSEYFSIIDDGEEDGATIERTASPRTLPPSPLLNRTAMSLVKERAKSRNSSVLPNAESGKQASETSPDNFESYQIACAKMMEENFQLSSSESDDTKKEISDREQKNKTALTKQAYCNKSSGGHKNQMYEYQGLSESNLRKALNEERLRVASEVCKENEDYKLKYEILKTKYLQDSIEWENKMKKEKSILKSSHLGSYMKLLHKTKKTVHELKEKFSSSSENQNNSYAEAATKDIQLLCKEIERISSCPDKKQKRDLDVKKWKKAITDLQVVCKSQQQKLRDEQAHNASLEVELQKRNAAVTGLQKEFQELKKERANFFSPPPDSLEENFCKKQIADSPDIEKSEICRKFSEKLRISDEHVKRLKRDLQSSHTSLDDLEIYCFQLKHDVKAREENHESQMGLMTARVDDLTSKLTISERNLRQLKQKVAKLESRQERRRSSLKNKESITLTKECESKLQDLEQKLTTIENELKSEDKPISEDVIAVNVDCERALGKRLSQDSSSGSENTSSLLLRLHTLSMRTKAASEAMKKQAQANAENLFEKPKICLQVRSEEYSMGHEDEEEDDWSALSYSTSLTDLQTFDGLDNCELPTSWPEVIECLDQKLESMLCWIKCSIQGVYRQEAPFAEGLPLGHSIENSDNLLSISSLTEVLESITDLRSEIDVNSKLSFKVLLLNETVKVTQRITSFHNPDPMEKIVICHQVYTFLQSHFHHLCDLENQNSADVAACSSLIEQLLEISSASYKDDVLDDFVQLPQPQPNRISLLLDDSTNLLKRLDEAKHKQFSALMQTLAAIPVQDPDVTDENDAMYAEEIPILDPLLQNMTAIVNSVHDMAVHQLLVYHEENESPLLCDHKMSDQWCKSIQLVLKEEINSVIDELKLSYLQVREKNVFPSDLTEVLCKKIVYGGVALALIALLRAVTQGVLNFLCDESSIAYSTGDSVKWIEKLQKTYLTKASTFSQPDLHYATTKSCENLFLSQILETGMREIRTQAVFYNYNQKKMESLCRESDIVKSENVRLKSIVDSHKGELLEFQSKMKHFVAMESCQECRSLEGQLQIIKKHHEADLFAMDKKCKEKMEQMQKHLQFVLDQKDEIHAQEVQKLEEQLQTTRKLSSQLEIEYNEQVEHLKELYQKKPFVMQNPINEESIRRRYQTEIEQLKDLWEKGLVVIQNSYRQITTELERRHKQEISLLEEEKEKLLKEETQATLTALEVMRKFHAEELQKELSKCKEELLLRIKPEQQQTKMLHQSQEVELEEVKCEIAVLSEKYSVKCLESAASEERILALQYQLQEANHQLFDLMARNKQLKVQLSMNIDELKQCPETKETGGSESVENLKVHVKLKEAEIVEQKEMNAQSKQELHLAQMHVSLLDVQCEQLYQSLNAERKLREEEVNSLRSRLEAIITASLAHADDPTLKSAGSRVWSPTGSFLCRTPSLSVIPTQSLDKLNISLQGISQNKELLRSPSWPGIECPSPKQ